MTALRSRFNLGTLAAYAACSVFLALSGYGFSIWVEMVRAVPVNEPEQLIYLAGFAIVPLNLFLILALLLSQHQAKQHIASSYQARYDQLQRRLNAQEDLLRVITDHDPESIAIFDKHNNYWFINASTADFLGVEAADIIGKSPAKFLSHDRAQNLEKRLNDVRASGHAMEALHQLPGENDQVRFMRAHYEPIKPFGDFSGGILMRAEDVTTLMIERKRRENMLRQVIGTLVAVIDRRDPHAAGHSERVGQLSRALAEEMVLDEKDIEAAEIAGSLMNFGKVLVPREILTKTSPLTPDELQRIRDSILTSADILSIIDFVGPVVPTLKQVLERYDGSGAPKGLKGDQILMTARIVTVANAYVALVSMRAHRASIPFAQAVENLLKDADRLYDPRVVNALANYIQNRSDKLDWLTASKPV